MDATDSCTSFAIESIGTSISSAAGKPSCAELEGAKPQGHLEYLQRDRSHVTPECAAYAIDQIGLNRYAEGIKTLIKYLDYRRPVDPAMARLPVISKLPTLGMIYPAAGALFDIGMPAVPDLVEAIASATTSDTARSNAVQEVFLIYRSDVAEGVRVLSRASKATADVHASQRLYDAAQKAATVCSEPMRNLCINALQ